MTTVQEQNVFLQPPPVSFATDPTGAKHLFFQANPSSLTGTWRCSFGLYGRIVLSQWGSWLRTAGKRVEVGSTRDFTLRGVLVEAHAKVPPPQIVPATPLFTVPGAVDLAVAEPFVYVASHSGGASTVVEHDLASGAPRVIGSDVEVRAIAVAPFGGELTLGLENGDLQRVAISNGALLATTSTGLGPLISVGYSRFGTRVWSDGLQLWSELVPTGPLYSSGTRIQDFVGAIWPTASATPFGAGGGRGAAVAWSVPGLPTLGNRSFSRGLRNGVGSSFALLVDPVVLLSLPTDAAASADPPLPIPVAPIFAGVELVAQWFVPAASAGPPGIASSSGLACAVR